MMKQCYWVFLIIAIVLIFIFRYRIDYMETKGDLSLIRECDIDQLKSVQYVENLMLKLGLNSENLEEQPSIVKENTGGLKIWQYPNQFSKYLTFLGTFDIKSYIEIGCRWGGTFILTVEYLKRLNDIEEALSLIHI